MKFLISKKNFLIIYLVLKIQIIQFNIEKKNQKKLNDQNLKIKLSYLKIQVIIVNNEIKHCYSS